MMHLGVLIYQVSTQSNHVVQEVLQNQPWIKKKYLAKKCMYTLRKNVLLKENYY